VPHRRDRAEEDNMNPVDFSQLQMIPISSTEDASIDWTAAFACYGGKGADNTVVVPFSIAPGGHLGWHTDSLEETQYIIAGSGELQRDDGSWPAGPGSIFVLPKDLRHDLRNTGTVPLIAIAGKALTQTFDNVMLPPKGHLLTSPNAAA
jgi:quercetin dioxygenase-like cupin family protein